MIKILDTTLRDGGYVNNWNFGDEKIKSIIHKLILAKIDIVELGFLSNNDTNNNSTIFNSIEKAQEYIDNYSPEKFCLMIKSGEYNLNNLKNSKEVKIKKIRYIFKKNKQNIALEECKTIIQKGYELFINPVFIDDYKEDEFFNLLEKINKIKPYALSIVDSMGSLSEENIKNLFLKSDNIISNNIIFCLHFHNNTGLALKNVKNIITLNKKRNLIIDCSTRGMGRGAGNLQTELLAKYLNQNYEKNYQLKILDDIINNDINIFYKKNPWGNKKIYFICAKNHCHSDYATYLDKKNHTDENLLDEIFKLIPSDKKTTFDNQAIENVLSKIHILQ